MVQMLRYDPSNFTHSWPVLAQTKREEIMKESKKIKRELHNFWLKQLDQREENDADRLKAQSPQQFSPLAADILFQRQLQRLKTQRAGNPTGHECLGHDFGAEGFEGQFYVTAADFLSLQRAEQDWNRSAGETSAPPRLSAEWQNIDDRLMWLGAPSL